MANISFFDPENEIKAKRQRDFAAQLLKQGEQTPNEVVSGIVVKKSPWEALSKALQTGLGGYESGQADQTEKDDQKKRQQVLADALSVYNTDPAKAGNILLQYPSTSEIGMKMAMDPPDVDKLGEQAIYKAAQGIQLTPQEQAAARYANAKSGGIQFDPVTGAQIQKPNIASELGLNLGGNRGLSAPPQTGNQMPGNPQSAPQIPQQGMPPVMGNTPPQSDFQNLGLSPDNQWDVDFKRQYDAAAGNPKLQQQLRSDYGKAKVDMNEGQSKAATFADRATLAEQALSDPANAAAYANPWEKIGANAPLTSIFGNYANSAAYNAFDQAQRNFETAKLRQESGATINPSEFATDEKTFLPRASDSPELLETKRINRETIKNGLARQAGPAYHNLDIKMPTNAPTNNADPVRQYLTSKGMAPEAIDAYLAKRRQ